MNTCCEKCGADLEFYDHELIEDKNERINIRFTGGVLVVNRIIFGRKNISL